MPHNSTTAREPGNSDSAGKGRSKRSGDRSANRRRPPKLPKPLTDFNLRGYTWLPLQCHLLKSSEWILASYEGRAGIIEAMGAAWGLDPAASLPDDDCELARLCGYGNAVQSWAAIRPEVLRGWTKCSD